MRYRHLTRRLRPSDVPCQPLEPRTFLSSTRFAALGDFGFGGQIEADVAARLKSWRPELIITTGDNNYPLGEAATIDANIGQFYHEYIGNYGGSYGPGSPVNRFFPSLGNHDWYSATGNPLLPTPYLNYFTLPGNERYYDFVAGPVHFYSIDADPNEPDGRSPNSTQGKWLQARLAASTSPWNIVYMHHPPYSSALHGSELDMQWPYKAWGADAVLAGHDHDYERIVNPSDGLTYFVDGLGGTISRYTFNEPLPGSEVRFNAEHGAMYIVADDAQITFQFITRWGELIDSWTLNASTTAPASPTSLSTNVVSSRQVDLTWTDPATDESGFRLERSINGGPFATIATLGPDVTTYSDIGLAGGNSLAYRVRTFNTAGDSAAYSNTATADTPAGAAAGVPAPLGFSATTPSPTTINLSWQPVAGAAGYKIEHSTNGIVYTPLTTTAADATTLSVPNLAGATLHYFRIRAFDTDGDSAYANVTQSTGAVPTLKPDLAPASDSGVYNDDDVTNVAAPTFTGGAAPSGANVRIYADNVQVGSGVAGPDGSWSVTTAPLVAGTHTITARFVDPVSGLSPASAPLPIVIDRTAPRVTQPRFNNDLAATPNVRRIAASFDEPVHATPAHLLLHNITTGQDLPAAAMAVTYAPGDNVATWSFPGRPLGLLENGNYTATLAPGITDLAGNPLDGDGNGQGGDGRTFAFYQLVGDVNGDRTVDRADLKLLLSRLNTSSPADPADLTGDGRVAFDDYQLLELGFRKSVPAPAPAAATSIEVSAKVAALPPRLVVVPRPVFAKKRLPRSDLLA